MEKILNNLKDLLFLSRYAFTRIIKKQLSIKNALEDVKYLWRLKYRKITLDNFKTYRFIKKCYYALIQVYCNFKIRQFVKKYMKENA